MVIFQKWFLIKSLVSATRPNLASRNHIAKNYLENLFSAGYVLEGFFLLFLQKAL